MTKLVFIQATLRGEQSKSIQAAQTYQGVLEQAKRAAVDLAQTHACV
ncbi:hypothetical protein [Rhodopila sp.]